MINTQPPAQFDWATELSDAQGHVTLSEQEAHEIGARLRAGYEARLEIESLKAQHTGAAYAAVTDERAAFEEMMRSQTFDSLKRLSDGSYESYEARVGWMAWNVRASHGQAPAGATLGSDAIYELIHGFGHTTHAQSMEIALGISNLSPPSTTPQAASQPAPVRADASYESMNLAVMVLSDCGHSSNYKPLLERVAGRIDRHVERLLTAQQADIAMRAQAAPQPLPASQGDAEDAARYRFLAGHCRSTAEHWGGRWSIVVDGPAPKSHDSEDDFDAAIDAARAAQEGK